MSKDSQDLIPRGGQGSSPLGTACFVGLRALDVPIQYFVLNGAWSAPLLGAVGTHFLTPIPPSATGISAIDSLGLSPYRLALLGMAAGSAIKQNLWKVQIAQEAITPGVAAMIAILNTFFNSINTLLFVSAFTSPANYGAESSSGPGWPPLTLTVGAALFGAGVLTEYVSELQRSLFKNKPEGKGKPYTGGLWSLSRHINYFGYTLWRTGFALAGGGGTWAAITCSMFSYDFLNRAIPSLDQYCENRYADLWRDYRSQVPYKFVPFAY